VIDLHMHTSASDGLCTPSELVARVEAAGIRVMAVTDHDTTAAVPEAAALAAARGIGFVPGIEITSVHDGHDVHVLGYFADAESPRLTALLQAVRDARAERAREIAGRLARAGVPIDVDALLDPAEARAGRSIARPRIARALVEAGHVASIAEAFDRFLSEGRPAFVPHRGPTPAAVVEAVRAAGGMAVLAHPGTTDRDGLVPVLVSAGLSALEAYHSAHDAATTDRYLAFARQHGLAVTGGSDFHGPGARRSEFFGRVALPPREFAGFLERRFTNPSD
jgi:predicted metal-dependent phosphoesterase TrpH